MGNHILWFFLWLLILQHFTVFDTILHLGALISPFLSVVGSHDLMPFFQQQTQMRELFKPALRQTCFRCAGCRVERFVGMDYRKIVI
jgi:hypothetical protein